MSVMSSLTKTFLHWTQPLKCTLLPVQLLQPFEKLCKRMDLPLLPKLNSIAQVKKILIFIYWLENQ